VKNLTVMDGRRKRKIAAAWFYPEGPMAEKKKTKKVKVHDLSPTKQVKGGATRDPASGQATGKR
jgi:hypothetical protein